MHLLLHGVLMLTGLDWTSANEHEANPDEPFQVFHVEWPRVEVPYLISVWILATTISKLVFYKTPGLKTLLPESSVMIIIGIFLGIIFFLADQDVTSLTPDIFFLYLLPPIIMEAGYFMPNRLFFDQLGTILLMAVVGTIFNMFTIGVGLWGCGQLEFYGEGIQPGLLESLLFGSLIAAVDPVAVLAVFEEIQVDEVLNIVVFGESLLNDGVAVVLYHMFEAFEQKGEEHVTGADVGLGLLSFVVVAGGGTLIGIIYGFLCAFLTRYMNQARVLETLLVLVMAYLSYLTAEIFHMSGILAITFCGITMKNYVEQNISENSSTTIKSAMHMLANCAEMTIFLFLGVYTVRAETFVIEPVFNWNWVFVIMTIVFCIVFRVIGVLILSAFANYFRIKKLNGIEQVIMMYGGLRGGVAFALVLLLNTENAPLFKTATIAMVYWTVFVQGITIKPVVKLLKVKTRSNEKPKMVDRVSNRLMDLAKTGIMDILGDNSEIPIRIRTFYKNLDDKYIKPLLLREEIVQEPKIFETYNHLMKSEALAGAIPEHSEVTEGKQDTLSPNWAPSIIIETETDLEKKSGIENLSFSPDEGETSKNYSGAAS